MAWGQPGALSGRTEDKPELFPISTTCSPFIGDLFGGLCTGDEPGKELFNGRDFLRCGLAAQGEADERISSLFLHAERTHDVGWLQRTR